jgi:hypothetical protein
VGVEQNGLATKKINAPEAVFQLADKRQPGRAVTGIGSGSVVLFQHTPDNIFIDVDSVRILVIPITRSGFIRSPDFPHAIS